MKTCLLFIIFGFLLTLTWAEDNSSDLSGVPVEVEGFVIDSSSGVGLVGVKIQIGQSSRETNFMGYFSIDVPGSGSIAVMAKLNGYKPFNGTININTNMGSFIIKMEALISKFGSSC